mmetsp:Transcript_84857/g.245348  ORF Transcript_84857/g.245348 Transcript_84857/m.245348 type:complete len:190 (+) Transcript_84857:70-639(+)
MQPNTRLASAALSCDKAVDTGTTVSCGISSVETHLDPVSDGALKLSGSADFEPNGEELWRRRIRLIPNLSESCPWATIDDKSLERAYGRYGWMADSAQRSEAGESIDPPSSHGSAFDIPPLPATPGTEASLIEATSNIIVSPATSGRAPMQSDASGGDAAWEHRFLKYRAAWVHRLCDHIDVGDAAARV